jgi:hypothetical protein
VNPKQTHALRDLLKDRRIASLGTLHEGEPYVSMVPFALLPEEPAFVVHVSQLSPHTKDMLESPRVSLLVIAPDTPDTPPQAMARLTIQGKAEPYAESAPGWTEARNVYLGRFPNAVDIFELPGFVLFAIRPSSIRFVGGFAQALTLTPVAFASALTEPQSGR